MKQGYTTYRRIGKSDRWHTFTVLATCHCEARAINTVLPNVHPEAEPLGQFAHYAGVCQDKLPRGWNEDCVVSHERRGRVLGPDHPCDADPEPTPITRKKKGARR